MILSNVFQLMHIKMWLHYPLIRSLDSYKVCLCFIVLLITVCTVGYVCLFCKGQVFVYFVSFLSSMSIYEVSYTWCLRHNICSAWFLDIRISTCFHCFGGGHQIKRKNKSGLWKNNYILPFALPLCKILERTLHSYSKSLSPDKLQKIHC